MSDAFESIPALLGPLYVDDNHGEVVVLGLGWPGDASEAVADALNADGSYLLAD